MAQEKSLGTAIYNGEVVEVLGNYQTARREMRYHIRLPNGSVVHDVKPGEISLSADDRKERLQ